MFKKITDMMESEYGTRQWKNFWISMMLSFISYSADIVLIGFIGFQVASLKFLLFFH